MVVADPEVSVVEVPEAKVVEEGLVLRVPKVVVVQQAQAAETQPVAC